MVPSQVVKWLVVAQKIPLKALICKLYESAANTFECQFINIAHNKPVLKMAREVIIRSAKVIFLLLIELMEFTMIMKTLAQIPKRNSVIIILVTIHSVKFIVSHQMKRKKDNKK